MPLLGGAHAWANSGVKSQSRAHWAAGERSPAEILLLLLLLLLLLGGGPGDEFDAALVSDKFFVVEAWQAVSFTAESKSKRRRKSKKGWGQCPNTPFVTEVGT